MKLGVVRCRGIEVDQMKRAVMFSFTNVSSFDVTFKVAQGSAGRNILFAGASSLVKFCPPLPSTTLATTTLATTATTTASVTPGTMATTASTTMTTSAATLTTMATTAATTTIVTAQATLVATTVA